MWSTHCITLCEHTELLSLNACRITPVKWEHPFHFSFFLLSNFLIYSIYKTFWSALWCVMFSSVKSHWTFDWNKLMSVLHAYCVFHISSPMLSVIHPCHVRFSGLCNSIAEKLESRGSIACHSLGLIKFNINTLPMYLY